MPRHALLVDDLASAAAEAAFPSDWVVTRLARGRLALEQARDHAPELIVVGRPADLSAAAFVLAVRLDHQTSLLPLVQVGSPASLELRAEPDAWADDFASLRDAIGRALCAHAERLRDEVKAEVSLVLPSDLAALDRLNALLEPWVAECGFNEMTRRRLVLSVDEVVANSIEWGNGNDCSLPVHIDIRLDREKASILIRDHGPGFDRDALPHAARPGDALSHLAVRANLRLREGGYGILMTRGMVDHLCYNDAGNEAHLVKYLPTWRRRYSHRAEAVSPSP